MRAERVIGGLFAFTALWLWGVVLWMQVTGFTRVT
jgi:hypothetical protein